MNDDKTRHALRRGARRSSFATFLPDYQEPFCCGNWEKLGDMWRTRMSKAETHEKMMRGTCGPVSGAS